MNDVPPAAHPISTRNLFGLPRGAVAVPLVALAAVLAGTPSGMGQAAVLLVVLGGAIMAAVYHAEILAHYLGEPFGTLVLAFAVTVIETALIVSIMLTDGAAAKALARDTLMAAIMITINGIVGLCLLVGGHRHFEQSYTRSGVAVGLAMLSTLAVLTLVLPNFTTSARGPFYASVQLGFVAVVSLVVYATFVVAQTIRHRDHFLQPDDDHAHEAPVPRAKAVAAAVMMVPALVAVVLLAKALSPTIKAVVASAGAPQAVVGIVIAGLVLAPEGLAAMRAARANRIQTSLNLAIGSALATIGLTIPAVAVTALVLDLQLELGLSMSHAVLVGLTLLVASQTLSTGRTTVVQGVIHLVIFATYLFISLVP
jgi:Ca2+:H+ antiporter